MNCSYCNVARITVLAVALCAITACGGGGSTPTTPSTYSISGTVSGVDTGESVVLQNNGGDNLTVSTSGPFTFATKVTVGSAYAVTASPPSGKACAVTGASGTASANVTDVAVVCGNLYTVRAMVSGLVGQGLELEVYRARNGLGYGARYWSLESIGITDNGNFAFPTAVPLTIYSYGVGIERQPQAPAQRCVVSSFTIAATNTANMAVSCQGFSYVTNAGDNTISAFSVDATTGAIASVGPPVNTGVSPLAIAGTNDRAHLYVVNSGSNSVSAFAIDSIRGTLTTVPGSPFAAGTKPRALALLAPLLYVANSGSDNLSIYSIESDGALTPTSLQYGGSRATGAGPSVIAIDPVGQFLYTANTGGSNDISAFVVDGLTPVAGSPFPSGTSVSSLAFGGAGGEFLYAANASGSSAAIYGFAIHPFGFINPINNPQTTVVDPNSGALSALPGFPLALPSCNYIVADQTRTYLYATTGSNVLGYRVDSKTGALSALPGFPIAIGPNATSVSIDPTNQFLYVANGGAGTVTSFELNAATGALTPMADSPFAVGKSADSIVTF